MPLNGRATTARAVRCTVHTFVNTVLALSKGQAGRQAGSASRLASLLRESRQVESLQKGTDTNTRLEFR